jgi:hypothetical protein
MVEKDMENKKIVTEAFQANHEATNDAQLKWTKPHLSPLGVADGTNTKFASEFEDDPVQGAGPAS